MDKIRSSTWLGLMSGSSLDGLDLVVVSFNYSISGKAIQFHTWEIAQSATIPLPGNLRKELFHSPTLVGERLLELHARFGDYCGQQISGFLNQYDLKIDGVGFHGHTVFHYPDLGFSFQLGLKEQIEKHLTVPVFTDFRNGDIAKGGQGTPLVPIMEHYLLNEYQTFLNLGGIANISFHRKQEIMAFDISPCNQLLNFVANQDGDPFDRDGIKASRGMDDNDLLKTLDEFDYYSQDHPKSLDNNQIRDYFFPILDNTQFSTENKLHSVSRHIATKICEAVALTHSERLIYCTGGGAHNKFLIKCIRQEIQKNGFEVYIPDKKVIDYKEAVLMALLGLLKFNGLPWFYSEL